MDAERGLIVFGTALLSIAALLGFVQERYRHSPDLFARWRVVHTGGAGGGVQLIALSAVWTSFAGHNPWSVAVAWGLVITSYAFVLGPMARAMGRERLAWAFNALGAVIAVPTYGLLPWLLGF